jgi:hypothetical protein
MTTQYRSTAQHSTESNTYWAYACTDCTFELCIYYNLWFDLRVLYSHFHTSECMIRNYFEFQYVYMSIHKFQIYEIRWYEMFQMSSVRQFVYNIVCHWWNFMITNIQFSMLSSSNSSSLLSRSTHLMLAIHQDFHTQMWHNKPNRTAQRSIAQHSTAKHSTVGTKSQARKAKH